MKRLEGKVAIVTGASKGIGAGIAKGLAEAGASVVVNYLSSREDADRVVSEIGAGGGRAIAIQANAAQNEDVGRLVQATLDEFGHLDVLVNNAAVFEFGPVEGVTIECFRHLYETNVWGPLQMIQKAAQAFDASGGSIINISSGVTRKLSPGSTLYAGTKGALDLITVVLSKELGPRNIRVNAVSPGATDTEGARAIGAMSAAAQRQFIDETPLGRVGRPDDVAPLAVFLASDEAKWVTGEIIHASGGLR